MNDDHPLGYHLSVYVHRKDRIQIVGRVVGMTCHVALCDTTNPPTIAVSTNAKEADRPFLHTSWYTYFRFRSVEVGSPNRDPQRTVVSWRRGCGPTAENQNLARLGSFVGAIACSFCSRKAKKRREPIRKDRRD